jgi:hypothetical protein
VRILAFIAGLIALTVGFCHNITRAEARAAQDAGTSPYLEESVALTNGDVLLAGTGVRGDLVLRQQVLAPGLVDDLATWMLGVAPGR